MLLLPEVALEELKSLGDIGMGLGHPGFQSTGISHHDEGDSVGLVIAIDDRPLLDNPGVAARRGISMRLANEGKTMTRRDQKVLIPKMPRGHCEIDRQAAAAD